MSRYRPAQVSGSRGGGAVFPLVAGFYGAAVLDVQQLHAVAHAQDGDIQALEPFKVNVRGVRVRGAFGTAGKDDGAGFVNLVQVFQRIQLGHVAQFAHARTMSWVYWEPKSMTATRCLSSM